MQYDDRYSLRPAANCVFAGSTTAVLLAPPHKEKLDALTTRQTDALRTLAAGPATLGELSSSGSDTDVTDLVSRLAGGGWLSITVRWEGQDLYTLSLIHI